MDQLLKMGFPQELAAQALAATGGKSTLRATEWILNQKPTHPSPSPTPQNRSDHEARVERNLHGLPREEHVRTSEFPQTQKQEQGVGLAATGGKSIHRATEWILNQKPTLPSPSPTPQNRPDRQARVERNLHGLPREEHVRIFEFPQTQKQEQGNNTSSKPEDKSTTIEDNVIGVDSSSEPMFKRPKFTWKSRPSLRWGGAKHAGGTVSTQLCSSEPLYERMRPCSIDDVVGQEHLLGKNCILRSVIDCDRLPSLILWGPPGTGKTSIARVMAASSSYRFVPISAVTAGVKEVREAVEEAKRLKKGSKRTVLFIDEVHRFNKAQQDSFLPVIEDGSILFMGATTENPSFHLITPLLSRCRVFTLNKLQPHHITKLLKRAVEDYERGLMSSLRSANGRVHMAVSGINVEDEAMNFLSFCSDGDARVALNALEVAATTAAAHQLDRHPKTCNYPDREETSSAAPFKIFEGGREVIAYSPSPIVDHGDNIGENGETNGVVGASSQSTTIVITVTLADAKEALQFKHLAYDKDGEEHYNLISALHKSMRGSDPDAAIYWLARMLEGGEEPLYIARRLIVFASEDVGLADHVALQQAVTCYQACHFLGMPECNVILAQCVAYLALAPKSVAVSQAIEAAQRMVRESGSNEVVPLHLRNAPTKQMKELGYGKGYIYSPDYTSSSNAPRQDYLPPSLASYKFLNWPPSQRQVMKNCLKGSNISCGP